MKTLLTALRLTLLLTLLTGAAYPALIGLAALAWPRQAGGSLVLRDGRVVGSALLAQSFTSAKYVHPRPSAASYATIASGASNLGPTSRKRVELMEERRAEWLRLHPDFPPPAEMLCASGSGLDPHISPAAALAQLPRVSAARGWDETKITAARAAVQNLTEGPQAGFLGPERVNVLLLNLALDTL